MSSSIEFLAAEQKLQCRVLGCPLLIAADDVQIACCRVSILLEMHQPNLIMIPDGRGLKVIRLGSELGKQVAQRMVQNGFRPLIPTGCPRDFDK